MPIVATTEIESKGAWPNHAVPSLSNGQQMRKESIPTGQTVTQNPVRLKCTQRELAESNQRAADVSSLSSQFLNSCTTKQTTHDSQGRGVLRLLHRQFPHAPTQFSTPLPWLLYGGRSASHNRRNFTPLAKQESRVTNGNRISPTRWNCL
jgi:hypothetical protein